MDVGNYAQMMNTYMSQQPGGRKTTSPGEGAAADGGKTADGSAADLKKTRAGEGSDAKRAISAQIAAGLKKSQTGTAADLKEVLGASKESAKLYGKTIGAPKLSEEGAKYYEKLKAKYGNMDFILVSKDQVENAKKNVAAYANGPKMAVLIDEEKIEKMATDEDFRNKYEGIIAMAQGEMSGLSTKLGSMSSVKGFGTQVDKNGNTNFFAVVKKNSDAQTEKLKEKQAEKKAEKKAAAKKEEKKAAQEKIEQRRADRAEQEKAEAKKADEIDEKFDPDEYEVITASSAEELARLVESYEFTFKSDSMRTPQEQMLGGSVDFKL